MVNRAVMIKETDFSLTGSPELRMGILKVSVKGACSCYFKNVSKIALGRPGAISGN